MITRLYVPLIEPEDVVQHLGKEEEHWKEGRSAHALATVWSKANSLAPAVAAVLHAHPVFSTAELIDGFFERQVDIRSAGRPSQTDLLAILGLEKQLAVMAVEGKAGESFGQLVGEWLDGGAKLERLRVLCTTLSIMPEESNLLRYQLLHRSASAIIEAKRYRTNLACLLVHSFKRDVSGLSDFCAFLNSLGCETPVAGKVLGPFTCDGVSLFAAWVEDEAPRGVAPLDYLNSLQAYAESQERRAQKVISWCGQRKAALVPAK